MTRPQAMRMLGRAGRMAAGALVVALGGFVTLVFLALALLAFLDHQWRAVLCFLGIAAAASVLPAHLARRCFGSAGR